MKDKLMEQETIIDQLQCEMSELKEVAKKYREQEVKVSNIHNHDSSHDTRTGCFQEADSRVINLSGDDLFHNQTKINMFKGILVVKFILL